jgi:nitrogen regulatory protein PII
MKKVEIIIQQRFFAELRDLMIRRHILNYSVFDISKGHGDKGDSLDYGFISVDRNKLLVIICDESEFNTIKENLAPYVNEVEGMIYVSPVELL